MAPLPGSRSSIQHRRRVYLAFARTGSGLLTAITLQPTQKRGLPRGKTLFLKKPRRRLRKLNSPILHDIGPIWMRLSFTIPLPAQWNERDAPFGHFSTVSTCQKLRNS